jgi:hypothetical protein
MSWHAVHLGSLSNAPSQTAISPSRMTQTSTPKPRMAAAFGVLHFYTVTSRHVVGA